MSPRPTVIHSLRVISGCSLLGTALAGTLFGGAAVLGGPVLGIVGVHEIGALIGAVAGVAVNAKHLI